MITGGDHRHHHLDLSHIHTIIHHHQTTGQTGITTVLLLHPLGDLITMMVCGRKLSFERIENEKKERKRNKIKR